jgi:hypothetical protein
MYHFCEPKNTTSSSNNNDARQIHGEYCIIYVLLAVDNDQNPDFCFFWLLHFYVIAF